MSSTIAILDYGSGNLRSVAQAARTASPKSTVIITSQPDVVRAAVPYPEDARPVFVGHSRLSGPRPKLLRHTVACLDWSVAKGGFLCAYRWDGEQVLDEERFVWCD